MVAAPFLLVSSCVFFSLFPFLVFPLSFAAKVPFPVVPGKREATVAPACRPCGRHNGGLGEPGNTVLLN